MNNRWVQFAIAYVIIGTCIIGACWPSSSPRPSGGATYSPYMQGIDDIAPAAVMRSGSIRCGELDAELAAARAVREVAGLHPDRIRGQIHTKYGIVAADCGRRLR